MVYRTVGGGTLSPTHEDHNGTSGRGRHRCLVLPTVHTQLLQTAKVTLPYITLVVQSETAVCFLLCQFSWNTLFI